MPNNATNLSRKAFNIYESFQLIMVTFHVLKGNYCTKSLIQLFESVQIRNPDGSKNPEKHSFYNWHDLRKWISAMKTKFTYKEFTLLAGIVVALIIVLALWLRPVTAESSDVSKKLIPPVAKPAAKAVVEKAFIFIHDSLQ